MSFLRQKLLPQLTLEANVEGAGVVQIGQACESHLNAAQVGHSLDLFKGTAIHEVGQRPSTLLLNLRLALFVLPAGEVEGME